MAMTPAQAHLWAQLESFDLDHPTHEPTFSERLRQEQGWTTTFASRVVREYRRFLLLAATEETLMVPSDEVDQAWHLHLVDTRAYWEELCGKVIHKALHHTPSRGGDDELERHWCGYEATLARYRATFDDAPPNDIWPPTRDRFGARHQRVNLRFAWVIPKRLPWLLVTAWAMLVAIVLVACAGTKLTKAEIAVAKGLAAVSVGVVLAGATRHPRRDGDGCSSGFDFGTAGDDGGCGGCGGCG
jgi:hypothetical protein